MNFARDQKMANILHKQVRSNHGSSSSHRQGQPSVQITQSKKGSSANAVFNPVALLQQHNFQQSKGSGVSPHSNGNHSAKQSMNYKSGNTGNNKMADTAKSSAKRMNSKSNPGVMKQAVETLQKSAQQLHFAATTQIGRNLVDSNVSNNQQKVHHQRGKFTGSFLASHNSKSGKGTVNYREDRNNYSVSPAHSGFQPSQSGHPMLMKQNQAPPHQVKISNKSPMAVQNPSTFTISTNQHQIASPNNVMSNGSGTHGQRFAGPTGSNPSSVKHNSTKQTVMSDILNATEQSTIKQRENIKVFSFKPGNLKVQPKMLNVQSLKTSQISLSKEHASLIVQKAMQKAPQTTVPSPKNGVITKVRNRSTGSTKPTPAKINQSIFQNERNSHQRNQKYHSPEGNVSNESKQPMIVMQPNISKKPMMTTNYSRENSQEGSKERALQNYHSPDQPSGQVTMRTKKKSINQQQNIAQPLTVQQSKRVKSSSRQSIANGQITPNNITNQKAQTSGSTVVQKIKIKKRGHSENMHTEASNKRTSSLVMNTNPPSAEKAHLKVVKSNHFSQPRGGSINQPSTISQVNDKLHALKNQQNQQDELTVTQRKAANDHKEIIVNHIRKYIKVNKKEESPATKDEEPEVIIQNLRDFLTYLENKNIINPQKLADKSEMKNLIKDIMKLDLSKFSKARTSSQPSRQPQHQARDQDEQNVTKKRKVLPSPAATHPTQFGMENQNSQSSIANFAKIKQQMSGKSIGHVDQKSASKGQNSKRASMETVNASQKIKAGIIKYEYASQPKYLNYGMLAPQQKGLKTTGNRSRETSDNSRSPDQSKTNATEATKISMSSVNFVLPSNRQTQRNNKDTKTTNSRSKDIYGVKTQQTSQLMSSQNSPERNLYSGRERVTTNESETGKSVRTSAQHQSIKIQSKEVSILTKKKRQTSSNHESNPDAIAVEEQLQKFKQSQKPRLQSGRGSRTAVPSTQVSPRHMSNKLMSSGNGGQQAGSSQPNLESAQLQQPQQIPTIQLMINTNGQGKFLGINVNNYCFAANQDQNQVHQMMQVQNGQNNSAEQLTRAQGVGLIAKNYQSAVKTEPDQMSVFQPTNQTEPDSAGAQHKIKLNQSKVQNSSQNSGNNSVLKDFVRQHLKVSNSSKSTEQQLQQPGHTRGQAITNNDSSEFSIMGPNSSNQKSRKPKGSGSYFDPEKRNEANTNQFKYKIQSSQVSNYRRNQQQQVMIIQDEDDDNTGGDGAEAKMSPTNNSQSNLMFNASRLLQQTGSQHQETPLVTKQQSLKKGQFSSSNRGGSGRSSQRTSSLTKALQLEKSQIQVAFGPKHAQVPLDQRSKESSQEPQEKVMSLNQFANSNIKVGDNYFQKPRNTSTGAPTAQNSPQIDEQKVVLNDPVTQDRDKLIRYIKAYVKKHDKIPNTTLDFYRFVKLLGKGAFGKITLGIHKLTGKYVAIKSIDKVNIKDEYSRRKVFQEVYILKKIRHSCVIRLLEVFESEKHFLMVMEYSGGGDLLQYVKKRKRLNEQSAKAIFKQILYALGHCHCRSVLHRDIKLDNVLMDGEGGVKLCDFGVSRLIKKGHTINEQCGTPAYLAPEIILDDGYQGYSADVWSLGVLLYAMVQGTVPFKAHNITDLHKLILKGDFEFPVSQVSNEVKDLITKMLVLDPTQRISIPSMLNHPWVYEMSKEMGDSTTLEDDEHDLRVGSTFFREEVLGGLITGYQSDGNENGNINFVNVENLYYKGGPPVKEHQTRPEEKVTYSDYCALTEDFMTYRIDEDAMEIVTGFGYPRQLVIQSINRGDVNHATAAYYLLVY